jgi:1-deoxy-D-xylulose-5-phosphate synthase
MSLIETLKLPEDLKKLTSSELEGVASEIRQTMIDTTSRVGGHLSSSLGAVELAVALHSVFNSPVDRIVWDVGHQAYAHKMLTGRLSRFDSLRQKGGLSGFPKREESPHDPFSVGHASTSISQALGLARARDAMGGKFYVIAVIGDGALSGGLSLEGLNNSLNLSSDMIVVLNDNQMCITRSVGAISNYLTRVRTSNFYINTKTRVERLIGRIPRIGEPLVKSIDRFKNRVKHFLVDFKVGVIFEELGFKYLGPIDGHNIPLLMSTLHFAKDTKGPVLIHVLTKKGKGYKPAEDDPIRFHGIGPFDKETGLLKNENGNTYTDVFGKVLSKLGDLDPKIVGITAAMLDGTGLEEFARKFPDRFYDVGIAEEHAVSFASGLACQGLKPVVAIYSTFLQRSYDQIVHDVCLNNLPVVFAIDRAGIVGEDGPTHNGVFDIAYLRAIPNMVVMAPSDENELAHMLFTATKHNGPISLRYPRGAGQGMEPDSVLKEIPIGRAEVAYECALESPKAKVVLIALGSMVYPAIRAAKMLSLDGIAVKVMNARFAKPLDKDLLLAASKDVQLVATVEEGVLSGGFGSAVLEMLSEKNVRVMTKRIGLPDRFVCHGKRDEMLKEYGLDPEGIASTLKKELTK